MKAAVIGAGRVGCGLLGDALRASGHEVVFVTRSRVLADHLNRVGGYRLRLVDCKQRRETVVDGVRAVCGADIERAARELASADLIVSCVRPQDTTGVAPLIAAGLRRRSSPVTVLTFENLADAGRALRDLVAAHLPSGWPVDQHGFSGAVAARVVSRRLGDPAGEEPLTFVADPPPGFVVDGHALRDSLPQIEGMEITDDYGAAVRHKLYLFSAGHAVTAYLARLKGYRYIHTAIRDAEIRSAVMGAMAEGRQGLASRYWRRPAGLEGDPAKIIERFDNAALDDPIVRVARDPCRKLGPSDRLVGAATLAEEAGIRPERLALAVAAALCFEARGDPSSGWLQRQVRCRGIRHVLKEVCRLDPGTGFGRDVISLWSRLSAGRSRGNLLLSLDELVWACSSTEAGVTSAPARLAR